MLQPPLLTDSATRLRMFPWSKEHGGRLSNHGPVAVRLIRRLYDPVLIGLAVRVPLRFRVRRGRQSDRCLSGSPSTSSGTGSIPAKLAPPLLKEIQYAGY